MADYDDHTRLQVELYQVISRYRFKKAVCRSVVCRVRRSIRQKSRTSCGETEGERKSAESGSSLFSTLEESVQLEDRGEKKKHNEKVTHRMRKHKAVGERALEGIEQKLT